MAGGDARYAHLLQPVKDLVHNWEIDVASNLEMYLEEVFHLRHTKRCLRTFLKYVEPGNCVDDEVVCQLADAAISFDGGTTTLDFAEAALIIQSSACVYSKKVEYLAKLVNEMLEIVTNRRKVKNGDKPENGTDAEFDDDDNEEFLSLDDDDVEYARVYLKEDISSEKPFQFLPEIPLSVMPAEDEDIGEDPLLSESGEVLGSRKDFMINKCYVDEKTGVLLIQMSNHLMLDQLLQPSSAAVQQTLQEDPITMETSGSRVEVEDAGCGDDVEAGDDDGPALDFSMQDHQEDQDLSTHDYQQAAANKENIADAPEKRKLRNKVEAHKKQTIDPLQLLDQYEELKPKPHAKKANIFKEPPGLKEVDKSKKRKRDNQKPAPALEPLNVYMSNTLYSNVRKYPKSWPKNQIDLAFDTIIWQEHKRRQSILRKQEEKKRVNRQIFEVEEDDVEEEEEDAGWDQPGTAALDDNDDDDLQPLEDDRLLDAINEGLRAVEDFRQNSPIIGHEVDDDDDCMDASTTSKSYEDLLRRYIDDYMIAARRYEQTSELSLRVGDWQNKIEPLLSSEERREAFDVNTYGKKVIDNLAEGPTIKFSKIVEGKTEFDTCRIFLVMLMLANTHNVKIKAPPSGDNTDNFEIQLLSSRRHFEEIQDFQAPSIDSTTS